MLEWYEGNRLMMVRSPQCTLVDLHSPIEFSIRTITDTLPADISHACGRGSAAATYPIRLHGAELRIHRNAI